MRSFFRSYLLYPRAERRAVVALCLLIAIGFVTPRFYHFLSPPPPPIPIDTSLRSLLARYEVSDSDMTDVEEREIEMPPHHRLLTPTTFDPNTIGLKDWVAMGLSKRQAAVIEKYKAKGGQFYQPKDLAKIYILDSNLLVQLLPFVKIAPTTLSPKIQSNRSFYSIEVNTADSAAWEALSGIGPSYAARIIRFRNILGGFYRISQVAEVWGLPDSTYQHIKPHLTINPKLVKTINVNEADYETLRRHPYLHSRLAKKISTYIKNNGRIDSLGSLRDLPAITDSIYEQIAPYLRVD